MKSALTLRFFARLFKIGGYLLVALTIIVLILAILGDTVNGKVETIIDIVIQSILRIVGVFAAAALLEAVADISDMLFNAKIRQEKRRLVAETQQKKPPR